MNYDLTLEELHEGLKESKRSFLIYQDADGNWRGFSVRDGKLIQERQGDPSTVLTLLVTHP